MTEDLPDEELERRYRWPDIPPGHTNDPSTEGVEPDFTEDLGTTDPLEAVEEGEPYFPPTDPVVRPAPDEEEGVEVVGGFQATSMEEVGLEGEVISDLLPGDEQIQEAVVRELREDALTADLRPLVRVRQGIVYLHGVVPAIEDAEAVVEVASRVEGVVDVVDHLEIGG